MFGSLKHTIEGFAGRLGYTVIPSWRIDTYPISQYMRKLFEFLNVDLVLDVGANEGQYYEFLRQQVGYQGRVISFEPIPKLAESLKRMAGNSPLWHIEAQALGSSPGILDFNIMKNTEMSSFLQPDHSRVGSLLSNINEIDNTVKVEVSTVDKELPGIVSKYGNKNTYLKIDAQGFELEVLKGATASLPGIAALQTEISMTAIYTGMPRYHEVIQFLEDRAFGVSGIYPNNRGHFPRAIEFDCYMINRSRIQ